jgi:putative mRNA 3-end processing factor
MVKIKFLGGAHEVGRSSYLLDAGDKVLLESGVKLNPESIEYPLPVKVNLNAAVISHAHLDHSGFLPALFTKGNVMTFMTLPTLELSKMLWADSLKIAKAEGSTSKFSRNEIKKVERFCFPVGYKKKIDITENVHLEFFDAGHILGSAMVKLSFNKKNLLFTGDFKVEETRLHKGADMNFKEVDYLMIESTYGNREHPPRKKLEKEFVEAVQDVIERGGWALIPAFAVGRCQEVIDVLDEFRVNAPIFLNGMGQKASKIMLEFPEFLKNPKFLGRALHSVEWVKKENKGKPFKEPSVIVTTAGMLGGGPVVEYIKRFYNDPKNAIFITGFQVKGTPGRMLQDEKKIPIGKEIVEVKAEVKKFDFSAHAGKKELKEIIKKANPELVILVHGDSEITDSFALEVKEMGFKVSAPKQGEVLELGD